MAWKILNPLKEQSEPNTICRISDLCFHNQRTVFQYDRIGNDFEKTWEAKKPITILVPLFLMEFTNNRRELSYLLDASTTFCVKEAATVPYRFIFPGVYRKRLCGSGRFYFDGHFAPYISKEDTGSSFFTLKRLAIPGHKQYWANDLRVRSILFLNSHGFPVSQRHS